MGVKGGERPSEMVRLHFLLLEAGSVLGLPQEPLSSAINFPGSELEAKALAFVEDAEKQLEADAIEATFASWNYESNITEHNQQIILAAAKKSGLLSRYVPGDPKKPLHRCNFYGSVEAGDKLKEMLVLGASRPWKEAMMKMTGQPEMSTKAIREYFEPLEKWLEEKNKEAGVTVGWGQTDMSRLCGGGDGRARPETPQPEPETEPEAEPETEPESEPEAEAEAEAEAEPSSKGGAASTAAAAYLLLVLVFLAI